MTKHALIKNVSILAVALTAFALEILNVMYKNIVQFAYAVTDSQEMLNLAATKLDVDQTAIVHRHKLV